MLEKVGSRAGMLEASLAGADRGQYDPPGQLPLPGCPPPLVSPHTMPSCWHSSHPLSAMMIVTWRTPGLEEVQEQEDPHPNTSSHQPRVITPKTHLGAAPCIRGEVGRAPSQQEAERRLAVSLVGACPQCNTRSRAVSRLEGANGNAVGAILTSLLIKS